MYDCVSLSAPRYDFICETGESKNLAKTKQAKDQFIARKLACLKQIIVSGTPSLSYLSVADNKIIITFFRNQGSGIHALGLLPNFQHFVMIQILVYDT